MAKEPEDYIKEGVDLLTKDAEEYQQLHPSQNEFDSWSALKLILHNTVTWMFTEVASGNATDFYYIDVLSGAGVSAYEGRECFKGSPLIAAEAAVEPFTKMFFIEKNPNHAEGLETRLQYMFDHKDVEEPGDWEVIQGDANNKISEVVDEIYDRSSPPFLYYTFVDNEKMDFKWDSICDLTPKPYGDLLINLPTAQAIGRSAGLERSQKLNDFYGMDFEDYDIPDNDVRDHMRELYKDRLDEQGRPNQVSTRVDGNVGSFYYDMLALLKSYCFNTLHAETAAKLVYVGNAPDR